MEKATFRPTETEVAQLMSLIQQPGYQILQKIMIGEVDKFQLDLLNVDPSSPTYDQDVRVKHNLALAAGMFYQRVSNRVASEIQDMNDRRKSHEVQPDITAELFS